MAMGTTEQPDPAGRGRWLRRLAWLIALWLASVGALFAVAMVFRWLMRAVGLAAP